MADSDFFDLCSNQLSYSVHISGHRQDSNLRPLHYQWITLFLRP